MTQAEIDKLWRLFYGWCEHAEWMSPNIDRIIIKDLFDSTEPGNEAMMELPNLLLELEESKETCDIFEYNLSYSHRCMIWLENEVTRLGGNLDELYDKMLD